MDSDTLLDSAVFRLSPCRSRCELVVSGCGCTETIASGLVKPFLVHLGVEEGKAAQLIRLDGVSAPWFNKGTLERFVRFVTTPEVLEVAVTCDAEMMQLEDARKIYAMGAKETSSRNDEIATAGGNAADVTKRELRKAIDIRLVALKQDLCTACSRASSAGFTHDSISELFRFADHFGASRLSEACKKFLSLCERRPDLVMHHVMPSALPSQWKAFDDMNVRCSSGSDMSIDEPDIKDGCGLGRHAQSSANETQLHRLSNTQHPIRSMSEPPMEQPSKTTMLVGTEKTVEGRCSTNSVPASSSEQRPAVGNAARMSVQERISLFENKQKEQAPSSSSASSSVVSRTSMPKVEHRRAPSMEKSVLRRWSAVSDMSIDLTNSESSNFSDRKDNNISVTPRSINNEGKSLSRAGSDVSGLDDTASSAYLAEEIPEITSSVPSISNTGSTSYISIGSSAPDTALLSLAKDSGKDKPNVTSCTRGIFTAEKAQGINKVSSPLGLEESAGVAAIVVPCNDKSSVSCKRSEEYSEKGISKNYNPCVDEHTGMKDASLLNPGFPGVSSTSGVEEQKDMQSGFHPQSGNINFAGHVVSMKEHSSQLPGKKAGAGEIKVKVQSDSRKRVNAPHREDIVYAESDLTSVTSQAKALSRKVEEVRRQKILDTDNPTSFSILEQNIQEGSKGKDDKDGATVLSSKKTKEFTGASASTGVPVEHPRGARSSKGNHRLNDELQMKAEELEKLFAAHKLRGQNDQIPPSRRTKSMDVQVDLTTKAFGASSIVASPEQHSRKRHLKDGSADDSDSNVMSNMNNSPEQTACSPHLGEESRGKSYEKYMHRREAKLREAWNLQRDKKEAAMKALLDQLDRSEAEMRGKLSRHSHIHRSAHGGHGANMSSIFSAIKENQGMESLHEEQFEQLQSDQDKYNSDNLSGDGSSRSTESKKHRSRQNIYPKSSTPRTSAAPIPKPSARSTSSKYANRKMAENLVAQSVPNFSDLKKENTKPPAGIGRNPARVQAKNFARSKSITESNVILKDDQSRRSQSMRKSCGPSELDDILALTEDIYAFAEPKHVKGRTGRSSIHRADKCGGTELSTRKYNRNIPVVGVARFEGIFVTDIYQNGQIPEGFRNEKEEDSTDDVRDEGEYERTSVEENLRESDIPADSESETPGLCQELNSDDGGSESGNILQSSKFNDVPGNTQAFSSEIPSSWNSHVPNIFHCSHDNAGGDAFVESPATSPAPWDSLEADVARMRKKWGSAHVPVIGATSSPQSWKDTTKGFKKLLKFGRKSRGVDSFLNDCVSASTASEGDDDLEDGNDLFVGSSDDLRKSRMSSHPSYDGFIESEVFNEQAQTPRSSIPSCPPNYKLREDQLTGSSLKAPRSFFSSLSSFRGKTGEAKLR